MALTPEIVQARIAIAKEQAADRDIVWDKYLKLLTNDWTEGKFKLAPNVIHATVRQLVATVMFEDPEFFGKPMQQKYADRARGHTAYMNYLWDVMEASEQTELVITDAIVYPYGVWKVGMGRSYMSEKQLSDIKGEEDLAKAEEDLWLEGDFDTPVEESQRHATHIPSHERFLNTEEVEASPFKEQIREITNQHIEEHGSLLETIETTRSLDQEGDNPDTPHVIRFSPRHLFTDGNHVLFEQSRYVLAKTRLNFDEWMENPVYKHPDNAQPTDISTENKDRLSNAYPEDVNMDSTMVERAVGVIDIWEHYDKADGTFSAWIEADLEPVRKIQPMPYRFLNGYPFEYLRFQIVPEKMHGPGTMAYLEQPQRMDMDIAHRIGTHVKNASTKIWLNVQALFNQDAQAARRELQNPEMDAVIETQGPDAVGVLPIPPIDASFFQMRGIISETVQEAVGLNDSARGEITGATATEVNRASQATQTVLSANAKKVRKGIVRVMEKSLAMVREFGPDSMVIPVWGEQNQWEEFKKDDLVGNWQINVELPLPGDKQNDLNNSINALHEMRASPNVKGEGLKRLEGVVLRRLDLEPDLFFDTQSVDAEEAVAYEHANLIRGELPQPRPGEDTTYHLDEHNDLLENRQREALQLQSMMQQAMPVLQQMQQSGQVDPNAMGQFQFMQQTMQQLQQTMELIQQHIDATRQLQPAVPQGQRRNALLFPTGNEGTAESIQANEIGGT